MRRKRILSGLAALLVLLLTLAMPMAAVAEPVLDPDMTEEEMEQAVRDYLDEIGYHTVAAHNYILLIDNSRSTTGRHSLGTATDPRGLRFDAARLVYNNVVTGAATGARGKIGVIVFCGTENCVTYGPLDIDDPALEEQIGSLLNAAANEKRRDDYTDIRTALANAKAMMEGFEEGTTSVILLTDGVNDLTNKANPFNRPENIAANEESVALVRQMHEAGADFNIVALTTQENLGEDNPLMAFINQLSAASGGEQLEDGSYSNVLKATQADLDSKLLQQLIKAESASEAIQTIVEYTPVDAPFTVPFAGISDAIVNLTFMPEDKAKIDRVAVVTPDGESLTLWEGGQEHPRDDIIVTEDRSYIMFRIPSPQPGEWRLNVGGVVDGAGNEARALINAVVRFNFNIRVMGYMPDTVAVGELVPVTAWFEHYEGNEYVYHEDSGLYEQSEVTLTMVAPDGQEKTATMKWDGEEFSMGFRPRVPGTWTARLKAHNPYYQEVTEEALLEVVNAPTATPEPESTPVPEGTPEPGETPVPVAVTEAPTPTPTPTRVPTPSPTPRVVQVPEFSVVMGSMVTADGNNYIVPGNVPVMAAWEVQGKTDYVEGELLENGEVVLSGIQSGDSLDRSLFKQGAQYELRVSAMPKNGTLVDAQPTVASVQFQLAPSVVPIKGIDIHVQPELTQEEGFVYVDGGAEQLTPAWTIDGEADFEMAALMKDGASLRTVKAGEALNPADFEPDTDYELQVSAMPKNGTIVKAQPVTQSYIFRVLPPAQPVAGLSLGASGVEPKDGVYALKNNQATLTWTYDSGDVDHYEVTVKDPQGNVYLQDAIGGSRTDYTFEMTEKGDYTVTLKAVPRYAQNDETDRVVTTVIRPHIASIFEKFWYFFAGGAVLLIAGIVALVLTIQSRTPKVVGAVRVRCEELKLDVKLTFVDERTGVKLASPITAHKALRKLKGKKPYALLQNVRVDNVRCNNLGQVSSEIGGPEAQARNGEIAHRPNERVVRLLYTDPASKRQDVCFVGRHDVAATAMNLEDGGKSYVFEFGPLNYPPKGQK